MAGSLASGRTATTSLTWRTTRVSFVCAAEAGSHNLHSLRLCALRRRGHRLWLQAPEEQGQEGRLPQDARAGCRAGRPLTCRAAHRCQPGPDSGPQLPDSRSRAAHHGRPAQVVLRVRLRRAVHLRTLRVQVLQPQVPCHTQRDALPQVHGLTAVQPAQGTALQLSARAWPAQVGLLLAALSV